MASAVRAYLAGIPVLRAWVFGSYSRGEETPESDLDLLVDYDFTHRISLLDTIRYARELEEILGLEVDLIANGSLKSFAVPSVEQDKCLIYEKPEEDEGTKAQEAFRQLRNKAEAGGFPDLTLEEINDEIRKARSALGSNENIT